MRIMKVVLSQASTFHPIPLVLMGNIVSELLQATNPFIVLGKLVTYVLILGHWLGCAWWMIAEEAPTLPLLPDPSPSPNLPDPYPNCNPNPHRGQPIWAFV